MARRVPQPPIQIDRRDPERHDFWLPFAIVLVAAVLLVAGTRHLTVLETQLGEAATEPQLIKAFANGGLERVNTLTFPDPALFEDSAALGAMLEQLADPMAQAPRPRYRVNTGAADPCPT
jgi:hypothetical protein